MQIKKENNKKDIVKILSIVIMLAGFVVILGWIFDVSLIKNVIPNAPSMKLGTTIILILVGAIIYYLNEYQKGSILTASIMVPFFTSTLILLTSIILVLDFTGSQHKLNAFLFSQNGTILIFPPIFTIAISLLISFVAMIRIFDKPSYKTWFKITGVISIIAGGIAFLGYTFNKPAMYYLIEGFSTGMAIHTSILFIISGISVILLSKVKHS